MGSLTSPKSARHHISPFNGVRICLHTGLHAYPRTTTAWAELPSCVTSSLAYYHLWSRTRPGKTPEGPKQGPCGLFLWVRHGCVFAGTGISTRCPSTTPLGLALGPDLPWAD